MPYQRLVKGFSAFRDQYFSEGNTDLFKDLIEKGQSPDTLVIACSDSRIEPALLTSSKPGEFFAVRNVAALVPPYSVGEGLQGTSSAIEFAVRCLEVKHVVVIGHAQCGGVNALMTGNYKANRDDDFEFLENWLGIGKDTKRVVNEMLSSADDAQKGRALEQAMILTSLQNLTSFPWIRQRFEAGKLQLHGWYFDMDNGALLEYNDAEGIFEPIDSPENAHEGVGVSPSLVSFLEQYAKGCGCKAA